MSEQPVRQRYFDSLVSLNKVVGHPPVTLTTFKHGDKHEMLMKVA